MKLWNPIKDVKKWFEKKEEKTAVVVEKKHYSKKEWKKNKRLKAIARASRKRNA